MNEPEVVPPSSEPDANVSTGAGGDQSGATPPPPPDESASTSGLGTADQQLGSAPPGDAPYDLTPDGPDDTKSPSGT